MPGTPWRIIVDVPEQGATATAGHFVLEMLAMAAILTALGTLVIWLAVHRSLHPLSAVIQALVALALGRVGAVGDEDGERAGRSAPAPRARPWR